MIEGSRCPSCARAAVPPEPRCLACRTETEAVAFPSQARILATTRTDPDAGWVALAEMDQGARVLVEVDHRPHVGEEIGLVEVEDTPASVFAGAEP